MKKSRRLLAIVLMVLTATCIAWAQRQITTADSAGSMSYKNSLDLDSGDRPTSATAIGTTRIEGTPVNPRINER